MPVLGFNADTVRWRDRVLSHDADLFVDLETVEYRGTPVRAYADRAASVDALFGASAAAAPDRTFARVRDPDIRFTYAEFDDRIEAVAAGLEREGVDPGDRVAMILPNGAAFLEVFFACSRMGAVAVPLNTRLTPSDYDYLLTDADPALVVADAGVLSDLDGRSGHPAPDDLFVVDPDDHAGRPYPDLPADRDVRADPPTETDRACVFYTSGTTGRPKGCPVDHFHLTNAAENYIRSFGFEDGTTALIPVPLFHVSGIVSSLLAVLPVAGTGVVMEEFSTARFLSSIESERVNYVMGVPTNYVLTLEREDVDEHDLSSLEVCAYGGAPMSSAVIPRLREAFPNAALCNTYGKTESVGGMATMCPDEYTDTCPESVGLPTPCVDVCVVDDREDRLPAGELGEIAIRGPIVVEGYLNDPERTAAEFKGGWHYTGDVGYVDEDGFVFLRGRKDDVIIRGGENVHPIEIREVLAAHPRVLESSVAGFPDEVLGERILAAVVPKPGAQLTEDDLASFCADRLAAYKRPDLFRILGELPRNPNGKVVKEEIVPEPLLHGIKAE